MKRGDPYMKKMVCLLLTVGLLASCAGLPQNNEPVEKFRATVLENNSTNLLVEPAADSVESKSADRIVVSLSGVSVTRADGEEGVVSDIAASDIVEISYSGGIAETYPAQIQRAATIEVVSHSADSAATVGRANPMKAYETPVYPEFSLVSYPQGAGLEVKSCWLISDRIAQLDYKVGASQTQAIFRAAKDDGSDISGVYFEFVTDETRTVPTDDGDVTVRERKTEAGTVLDTWERGGWAYSLYLPHAAEDAGEPLLATFVTGARAEAPDAEGSVEELTAESEGEQQ
jgi:hypothetical protein